MIYGDKVNLYPLDPVELSLILKKSYESFDFNMVDFEVTRDQAKAIEKKILKINKLPDSDINYLTYYLIIEKFSNKGIGLIGFKGLDEEKTAEIGYGITRQYEGQGLTSAALKTLLKWVKTQGQCQRVTATRVLKSNYGSQKVLEKNGFRKSKEDAYELTYMRVL